MQRSPQHSYEYISRRELQLAITDELSPAERALVCEYGFDKAMLAIRQHYGRLGEAAAALEAQREALQSQRWGNIKAWALRG